MLKECKIHGLTEYGIRKRDGLPHRCRKCATEAVQRRRRKLKVMGIEYKGGKCQNPECGYNKCVDALEFHHLSDKDFGISSDGHIRSWEKIRKELDKCILLCSNCHRELHAGILKIE